MIKYNFKDPKSFKELSKCLILELNKLGSINYANELNDWVNTSYTTSSEYLGELRIILNKILIDSNLRLPREINNSVKLATYTINKAFGET